MRQLDTLGQARCSRRVRNHKDVTAVDGYIRVPLVSTCLDEQLGGMEMRAFQISHGIRSGGNMQTWWLTQLERSARMHNKRRCEDVCKIKSIDKSWTQWQINSQNTPDMCRTTSFLFYGHTTPDFRQTLCRSYPQASSGMQRPGCLLPCRHFLRQTGKSA